MGLFDELMKGLRQELGEAFDETEGYGELVPEDFSETEGYGELVPEDFSETEGYGELVPEAPEVLERMEDRLAVSSIVVEPEPIKAFEEGLGAEVGVSSAVTAVELDVSKMLIYSELLNPKFKEY